jgi:hypothetical protein
LIPEGSDAERKRFLDWLLRNLSRLFLVVLAVFVVSTAIDFGDEKHGLSLVEDVLGAAAAYAFGFFLLVAVGAVPYLALLWFMPRSWPRLARRVLALVLSPLAGAFFYWSLADQEEPVLLYTLILTTLFGLAVRLPGDGGRGVFLSARVQTSR